MRTGSLQRWGLLLCPCDTARCIVCFIRSVILKYAVPGTDAHGFFSLLGNQYWKNLGIEIGVSLNVAFTCAPIYTIVYLGSLACVAR